MTFVSCWTHEAEIITCWASRIWDHQHQQGQDRQELSTEKSPFQAELQDEKVVSVGPDGPFLLDWGSRLIRRIQWIITAWFVGRKCPFLYMEYMRSFDTSRAPSIFRDINVFVWKLQLGGCLIKKAIQWESKNLGGSGSWGLHKWWETESILFQMTSWWTFRLQLTSVFLYSQMFQFWSRHYVWVRATNLSTSSSSTSL